MLDLLALIGAIVMIIGAQLLRAVLSLPFARVRAEVVPGEVPPALALLFDPVIAVLGELGFGSPRGVAASRVDGEPLANPHYLVLQRADGTTAWLGPPSMVGRPHQVQLLLVTLLADGRHAVTQSFDPFLTLLADDRLLARVGAEPTLEARVAAHDRWLASLGSAAVQADDAALVRFTADEPERLRSAMIADGRLVRVTDNLAEPGWRFAWRVLRAFLAMAKPPPIAGAISNERLALFARQFDIVRERSPRRAAQWTLFAASVVAFMLVGGVVWGVDTAWSILVVIVVHELGHFLAMRAFGYRHVHMLALPLVGGVAMGQDADPAATRRAWMSLMGPLPGILIGWVLLAAVVFHATPAWAAGFALPLAAMFLLINYLNLLPVPPLDGAHVFAALLPARMRGVQVAFVAIAAAVGAWLAWHYGLTLLAALAGLQLLGVPAAWRLRVAERELAGVVSWRSESQESRTMRALRAIERQLGPAVNAKARVDLATAMVTRVDMKPMGNASRALIAAVYVAVLAIPVVGLMQMPGLLPSASAADEAKYARQAQELDSLQQQARGLSMAQLLVPGPRGESLPSPASPADITAAEARLGAPLGDELRALLTVADGAPDIGLAPVREWTLAAASIDEFAALGVEDALNISLATSERRTVPFADARSWWRIGGDDEGNSLFWLPREHPDLRGIRFVDFFLESPTAYPTVRAYIEQQWASNTRADRELAARRDAIERRSAGLADADVATLLAALPEPSSIESTYARERYALPDPATDAAIAAVEARFGRALPADYRALLTAHDGLPRFDLLPIAELARWNDAAPGFVEYSRDIETLREQWNAQRVDTTTPQGGTPLDASFGNAEASRCVVVSVMRVSTVATPRLLWCEGEPAWADVATGRAYRDFSDWLRAQVALAVVNAER